MKDDKGIENKELKPADNKAVKQVRIKIRPGRSVAGVTVDEDGYASVDAKTANRLYRIGYAVKED